MFSWEGLGFIASAVGKPTKLHPDTETCKSFEEAKVSVIADLTKELPKSSRFKSKKGIDTVVEFSYPWLPARCNLFSKWGHISADCVVGKTGVVYILARKDNRGEKISAVASPVTMSERATHEDASTILTPQAVGDKSCGEVVVAGTGEVIEEVVTEEVATAEVVTEEAGNDKTESESQLEEGEFNETSAKQPQPTLSDQEETGKWISVSPAKIGRQVSITETNISILSPSSFSVLADEESTEVHLSNVDNVEDTEKKSDELNTQLGDEVCNWMVTHSQHKKKNRNRAATEESGTRQSLPRSSKSNHKIIQGTGSQGVGGKGSSQKIQ